MRTVIACKTAPGQMRSCSKSARAFRTTPRTTRRSTWSRPRATSPPSTRTATARLTKALRVVTSRCRRARDARRGPAGLRRQHRARHAECRCARGKRRRSAGDPRQSPVRTAAAARGYSVDLGLMQVNSRHLAAFGLTVQQALDPCTNIRAGDAVLTADYLAAARAVGPGQRALRLALAMYNAGSFRGGVANGYVGHYYRRGGVANLAPLVIQAAPK